jgi:FKBP-type peptidyl-prolyl cis-trans isomerase
MPFSFPARLRVIAVPALASVLAACSSLTQPPAPETFASAQPAAAAAPAASSARPAPSAQPTAPAPTAPPANEPPMQSTTLVPGKGPAAKAGDNVSVRYTGTFTDGKKFDSTADHGNTPFKLKIGAGMVIKGWDQGLVGMKVGEKRKLVLPPSLAYGPMGKPPVIPPNSTLVFEIELVSIDKP